MEMTTSFASQLRGLIVVRGDEATPSGSVVCLSVRERERA